VVSFSNILFWQLQCFAFFFFGRFHANVNYELFFQTKFGHISLINLKTRSRVISCQLIQAMQSTLSDFQEIWYACRTSFPDSKYTIFFKIGQEDFGMKALWSFLATSHGKSPCDGIGGTMKISTAMESFRQPLENQILNINDIVTYCSKSLTSITFQILPKE